MKGIASEAVSDHIAEGRRSDRGLVLSEFKHVIAAHDFEKSAALAERAQTLAR